MSIIAKTGNQIKEDGTHLLYDSLQSNSTLTSLDTDCKLESIPKQNSDNIMITI